MEDLQLQIYISAKRQDRDLGRVRNIFKLTTNDMIANVGTKLEIDGTIPIGNVHQIRSSGVISIATGYKVNGDDVKPRGYPRTS